MAGRGSLLCIASVLCTGLLVMPLNADDVLGAYALTIPASSVMLSENYSRTDLRITCKINYSKPGNVLDTVGINAAPVGSFTLSVSADGHVNFAIYDPTQKSDLKLDNGWHLLTSATTIPPKTDGAVQIDVKDKAITLAINGKVEKTLALAVKLSGKAIYVGDNPEDDSWGEAYNIHPAMIGTVTVEYFGKIQDTPAAPAAQPAPPAPAVPPAPATPVIPGTPAKGPLTDPPSVIDAGVKGVEDAFRAGKLEDVLKLVSPAFRSRYKPIFEAHQDQLSRIADILATRKLVASVGCRAEFEVTSGDRTLTLLFEKVDGVWTLSAL